LGEVLRLNTDDVPAWFNLGQALHMMQDVPRALQAFDRVLRLQPHHAEALFGRDASQALRLNPDHLGALREQANALLVAGAFDRAWVAFGELERRRPGAPFVACMPKHLARLQLADLSLETLPYNAHTTASEALWAGVPHVTCMGQSFASRVRANFFRQQGCRSWSRGPWRAMSNSRLA